MKHHKRIVIVFARAPVPGRCKTRLIPALGREGAAKLHRRLVLKTLRTALGAGTTVELWCAPDTRHGFFLACRREFGVRLRGQPSGDLGRRMSHALTRALYEGADQVVLIGTDCPSLGHGDIRGAFSRLSGGKDCVLQASTDGGYVLICAQRFERRALAGIRWSSGHEGAQTRNRLRRLGLSCAALPPRKDVDTPGDFRSARRQGLL